MERIKRSPILTFILLSFFISWILGVAWAIVMSEVQSNDYVTDFLMRSGPSLAGLLTAFLIAGSSGIKNILRSAIKVRAPLSVYLFGVLTPPIIIFGTFIALGYQIDYSATTFGTIVTVLLTQIALNAFLGGGITEELGWRGFMLPKLMEKHSALVASFYVAIPWLLWHLPAFALADKSSSDPLVPFIFITFALSIIYTWIYLRSNGSTFMAILTHGSLNGSFYALVELYPDATSAASFQPGYDSVVAAIWIAVAFALIVITGKKLGSRNTNAI